jgi:hypothetical protein
MEGTPFKSLLGDQEVMQQIPERYLDFQGCLRR